MIEYLNENNALELEKLFKKALKKYDFPDISKLNKNKCSILYKEGKDYVGFLEGYVCDENLAREPMGIITSLFVLPPYRNEGKATSMMEEFELWAKNFNCEDIICSTPIKNKKSLDFFEKIYFTNEGTHILLKKNIKNNKITL